jgi:hypothetical protein
MKEQTQSDVGKGEDSMTWTSAGWAFDDAPAIIPKKLWDGLIEGQEMLLKLGEAVLVLTQSATDAALSGNPLDEEKLRELQSHLRSIEGDYQEERAVLEKVKTLLVWVPPDDVVEV